MELAKLDWTPLRGALALCAASAVLSAALIGAGGYFRDRMRDEFTAEQQRFRNISMRYLAIDEDLRIIQEQLPEFERLYRAGIIGAERRLDWLELLRVAAESIRLPEFSYRIEPQRPHATELPLQLGRYELRSSLMTLDLGLLHEGDLLELFRFLDARADGLYHVTRCALDRIESGAEAETLRAHIKAQCELSWFTIDFGAGSEIHL